MDIPVSFRADSNFSESFALTSILPEWPATPQFPSRQPVNHVLQILNVTECIFTANGGAVNGKTDELPKKRLATAVILVGKAAKLLGLDQPKGAPPSCAGSSKAAALTVYSGCCMPRSAR